MESSHLMEDAHDSLESAGSKWSDGEEDRLITAVECGISIENIALDLRRSSGAIRRRLILLAAKKVACNEASMQEVCEAWGLAVHDLERKMKTKRVIQVAKDHDTAAMLLDIQQRLGRIEELLSNISR